MKCFIHFFELNIFFKMNYFRKHLITCKQQNIKVLEDEILYFPCGRPETQQALQDISFGKHYVVDCFFQYVGRTRMWLLSSEASSMHMVLLFYIWE